MAKIGGEHVSSFTASRPFGRSLSAEIEAAYKLDEAIRGLQRSRGDIVVGPSQRNFDAALRSKPSPRRGLNP